MSKFPREVLGDLIEHQKGFAFKSKNYQEKGIPVVRVSNFTSDSIDSNDLKFVSEEHANENQKVALRTNDVIIATVGSWPKNPASIVGKTISVPSEMNGALMNQNSVILRVKNGCQIDQKYLFIALKTKTFSEYLVSTAQGSANQASVTLGDIFSYEVEWPSPEIRKAIVSTIDSMNQKIKLNRQTNQTLEQIAQAIFKSWFVDFEPTRAKIAAKEEWAKRCLTAKDGGNDENAGAIFVERATMAAISGKPVEELDQLSVEQQEKLKTTAALFPETLVDSELGKIPEGWEVKLNGEVMDVRDGTHDSPKQSESGFPLVTSKHITSGVLKMEDAYLISEEDYEKVNKRSRVNQDDILLTMIGTVGIPYLVSQPEVNFAIKNVGLFRTSEVKELKNYFYLLLKSSQMKAYLDARMAGTTQKYLSLKTLRSIELLTPSSEVLDVFNAQVSPIMEKMFSSVAESHELGSIRDTLLPKLLTGELAI